MKKLSNGNRITPEALIFYSVMGLNAVAFLIILLVTNGAGISIIEIAKRQTLSEFFYGITVSLDFPYKWGSFATPFANLIYKLIILFIPLKFKANADIRNQTVDGSSIRMLQPYLLSAAVVLTVFAVLMYFAVQTVKKGTRKEVILFTVLAFLSVGMLRSMITGSLDFAAVIAGFLYVGFADDEKMSRRQIAYCSLAVGASIYPPILLLLLLNRKKRDWVGAVEVPAIVVVLNVISSGALIEKMLCIPRYFRNLETAFSHPINTIGSLWVKSYSEHTGGVFGLGWLPRFAIGGYEPAEKLGEMAESVGLCTAVLFAALLIITVFFAKSKGMRIAAACVLSIGLMPYVKNSLLIILLLPVAVIIDESKEKTGNMTVFEKTVNILTVLISSIILSLPFAFPADRYSVYRSYSVALSVCFMFLSVCLCVRGIADFAEYLELRGVPKYKSAISAVVLVTGSLLLSMLTDMPVAVNILIFAVLSVIIISTNLPHNKRNKGKSKNDK